LWTAFPGAASNHDSEEAGIDTYRRHFVLMTISPTFEPEEGRRHGEQQSSG
jgi:hypothetical protein